MPAWTTEYFIEKAREKHGQKYDYEKTKYLGSRSKVTVTCRDHGDFEVTGANHIKGNGCAKCSQEASKANQTFTTETFVEKAKEKHGDTYDYAKTIYVHSKSKVIIICKIHGDFELAANFHLYGRGCSTCGMDTNAENRTGRANTRKPITSTEDFIELAKAIHGEKYDYSRSRYIDANTRIDVDCPDHGPFTTTARGHVDPKQMRACPKCGIDKSAKSRARTTEQFIQEARDVHGDRYDYSNVEYKNEDTLVKIVCKTHGMFEQKPCYHIRQGSGCQICGGTQALTTATFIERARSVHGDFYDYSNVTYTTSHFKVIIGCPKHGNFEQRAFEHLQGHSCFRCWVAATTSKMQMQWLAYESFKLGREIRHAHNSGEFEIPGSRYRADGFDPVSNTVFEFHGTLYHCDPRVWPPNELNPYFGVQNFAKYQKTLVKEEHIINCGLNLVVCWELDWLAFLRKVKLIQKTWRSRKARIKRHNIFTKKARTKH